MLEKYSPNIQEPKSSNVGDYCGQTHYRDYIREKNVPKISKKQNFENSYLHVS